MTELVTEKQGQLEELCRRYCVRRLDLMGSAARGDFDAGRSDLDFVVEFDRLTVEDAADRFLGLLVDLEDLFGRKIDLISYTSIRNPWFKREVDRTRQLLYAA